MTRPNGSLRRGWRLRHALAVKLAPWLDHPNLRYRWYAGSDLIPVLVSRQLIEQKPDGWSHPLLVRFYTYGDGMVDLMFKRPDEGRAA